MIINRQHLGWAAFVVLASAAAAVLYLGEFHPERLPFRVHLPAALHGDASETGRSVASTPLGLIYGGIAAAIFLFAVLLGVRRKRPTLKVGRMRTWVKAHIWLTLLTIPLVLLHCGFAGGSPMTQWLLVFYAIVMLSGIFGLALQQFLPSLMKERVPMETVYEQIPHLLKQLREAGHELRGGLEFAPAREPAGAVAVAGGGTAVAIAKPKTALAPADPSLQVLKQFLDESALPYLNARRGDKLVLGPQRASDDQFRLLKISVGPEWQSKVGQLQSWCNERRQLDLQTKLQHWLHGWLLVHIPFSVILVVYTAWHAVAGLFFY